MPQRHSLNNGSHTFGVFTAHERKKSEFLQKEKARISADSQLPFGFCALSLQPAEDPVVTPSGHIYSRQYLLEHMSTKVNELKRRRDEWETTKIAEEKEFLESHAKKVRIKEEEAFCIANDATRIPKYEPKTNSTALIVPSARSKMVPSIQAVPENSFWLPHLTPQAPTPDKQNQEPPPKRPPSPITGTPLRMKDLIPISLHKSQTQKATTTCDASDIRFLCHVSRNEITNQPVLFIRTTGCVVIQEVATRLRILQSKICPITGRTFRSKDVLTLATASSSFAASGGSHLVVTKYRPTGGGA